MQLLKRPLDFSDSGLDFSGRLSLRLAEKHIFEFSFATFARKSLTQAQFSR